ncbi:MAG: DNA adenine methylase [Armatimonadetes bacterium]|nr:DNA adenine methylase [Armatimonadota bacterium]
MRRIPHPIPYQGSKRHLAAAILPYVPAGRQRFFEPFSGSAAITLAAADQRLAQHYVISDVLAPLAEVWGMIVNRPQALVEGYEDVWLSQVDDPAGTYNRMRDEFNRDHDPVKLLYLLARCVKASVRFNRYGEFNQSADHRRLGMRPSILEREVAGAHALLAGRTSVLACDFRDVLAKTTPRDIVYMDPPYQGTTNGKDQRYLAGLPVGELTEALRRLNDRRVPFLLSYDGFRGKQRYGEDLPAELGLRRVLLNAGRSTQATLNGKSEVTVESLYLSPALVDTLTVKGPALQPPASFPVFGRGSAAAPSRAARVIARSGDRTPARRRRWAAGHPARRGPNGRPDAPRSGRPLGNALTLNGTRRGLDSACRSW